MKANIKKLALLMIITVIATFILAATVTADRPGNLRGQYAATGSSTCLIAVCGFEPKYVTNCNNGDCGIVQSSTNETVFTFERDGTGTVSGTAQVVVNWNPAFPSPYTGIQTIYWRFNYYLGPDGTINITEQPGTFVSTWVSGPSAPNVYTINGFTRTGHISPDGKTIVLTTGVAAGGQPAVMTLSPNIVACPPTTLGYPQMICTATAVLTWQHE
jgi:hypothetical protein